MAPSFDDQDIVFDGSNWDDLDRLATRARMAAKLDKDVAPEDEETRTALLMAYSLGGAALDWYSANMALETPIDVTTPQKLKNRLMNHFGWSAEMQIESYRKQLKDLVWDPKDLPTFFADFTRLTSHLGINADQSRIMILREKAPASVWVEASHWGIINMTFAAFRDRTLACAMIASLVNTAPKARRVKCGNCGKRGHSADHCRNPKK